MLERQLGQMDGVSAYRGADGSMDGMTYPTELTVAFSVVTVRLVNYPAHAVGVAGIARAVHDHIGDRDLAAQGLASRLEQNDLRETTHGANVQGGRRKLRWQHVRLNVRPLNDWQRFGSMDAPMLNDMMSSMMSNGMLVRCMVRYRLLGNQHQETHAKALKEATHGKEAPSLVGLFRDLTKKVPTSFKRPRSQPGSACGSVVE